MRHAGLACRTAPATLDIFKQDNVIQRIQTLAAKMAEVAGPCHPQE